MKNIVPSFNFTNMLNMNGNQDIIKIYNNTKLLHLQRKYMSFVSEVKTLGAVASLNGKTFQLVRYILQTKCIK